MALTSIEFDCGSVAIPREIAEFLRAIDDAVERHRVNTATTFQGFVPSDYQAVYRWLKGLFDSPLLTGKRFCEWGSGVSIVASLAAMIGYESFGIEYDRKLCSVAEGIREEFDISVELVNGSFIPEGVEDLIVDAFAAYDGELAMHTDADDAYDEMDYAVNDFDIIFAFPWPNDIELTLQIFDHSAAQGAVIMAYHDVDTIGLFRKV